MFKKGLLNRFVSTQESQLDTEVPETSETDGSNTSLVFRKDQNKWIRPDTSTKESTSCSTDPKSINPPATK